MKLDPTDIEILEILQEHCKTPLAKIGDHVGLSAPAVIERIKKLEEAGVITGYTASIDARKLGRDIAAFIGVIVDQPVAIQDVERQIDDCPDVLECHHVTGEYTLLLKVKTANTQTLEELIAQLRTVRGVSRTETLVVLSTHREGLRLDLKRSSRPPATADGGRRIPNGGGRRLRVAKDSSEVAS
jgi:Lrp/AsnC family leucine-responsive transcriptional regulator